MNPASRRNPVSIAVVAALSTAAAGAVPSFVEAAQAEGHYAAGDFHNHTTCSDGSISMQKLVKKATDTTDTPWGLDWFVQAGHGGSGNRNCTLVEDASLATPAYPLSFSPSGAPLGPTTTWLNSNPPVQPKGLASGSGANRNMWRWQSIQEFQYPLIEYLNAYSNKPLFLGIETVVPGHEHTSMTVIAGQAPRALDGRPLPTTAGYSPLGDANALAKWEYCFDRNDTDTSRGNTAVGSGVGNSWDCSVNGSANAANPSWNAVAAKLIPTNPAGTPANGFGGGIGLRGHEKSVESLRYLAQNHSNESYFIPAHLERAGPFNRDGNNGFNIEHLRDLNNAAPTVAFGFETQPGHGASSERGEYFPARNSFTTSATTSTLVDSVGGTTYGGTGVYGAQVGGVWDALLGEGRNWWFFASSDWHNRGQFGPDDRRSTQDFLPGEYQRNYAFVSNGSDKLRPQSIVDGLRTGNNWVSSGQLIDRLAFVACATYPNTPATAPLTAPQVDALAIAAAHGNTSIEASNCASMGQKLVVRPGAHILVSVVTRDPAGTNYSPYSFANPSLAQIDVSQPLNRPALDHVDLIQGLVTGYRQPGSPAYAGEWPRDWLSNPNLANVPAAAKNESAQVVALFNDANWKPLAGNFIRMNYRIPNVAKSQYLRLRGSNLPANVPFETDASGNPLPDVFTNATVYNASNGADVGRLSIPCNATGSNVPAVGSAYPAGSAPIDGCPTHLPVDASGQKYVAYDVAAWADLWFYSNPIYVEVEGTTQVAGVL